MISTYAWHFIDLFPYKVWIMFVFTNIATKLTLCSFE